MTQEIQIVPGQPITVPFPSLSALQQQAQAAPRILALAQDIPVTNTEQCEIANQALRTVLQARDALEKDRTDVTGPLHKTKVWIDSQYKPARDCLDAAAGVLRFKVESFVTSQRQERERQFALAQQAQAIGANAAMAVALNQSSAIQTSAPAGTTVIEEWRATVINAALVPYKFLCPDVAKIEAHASATKPGSGEPAPIPGVRFTLSTRSVVRR